MNKLRKRRVAIAGATGMVGRRFAELLIHHPWFEIAMLVGHKSIGSSYGDIWERKETNICNYYNKDIWAPRKCPEQLKDRRIHSTGDLMEAKSIDFVFSAIPPNAWNVENELLAAGHTIFSNTPYGRLAEENPLVVTEVNAHAIRDQSFIKNPNCVSSGLALVLAPIRARYGLKEVSIVTFQSLTGKGDAKYPQELVVGNVYSLHNSDEKTEENILAEMQKIFREAIPLSVSCNRVFVQEGHLVNVKIKTFDRIKSEQEITELLESFDPLRRLRLPSSPRSPLTVIHDVGRPRPRQDSFHDGGMSVAIGGVSTKDSVYDCKFQYVVNNLVRGAAGGAILNSELYIQKEN